MRVPAVALNGPNFALASIRSLNALSGDSTLTKLPLRHLALVIPIANYLVPSRALLTFQLWRQTAPRLHFQCPMD